MKLAIIITGLLSLIISYVYSLFAFYIVLVICSFLLMVNFAKTFFPQPVSGQSKCMVDTDEMEETTDELLENVSDYNLGSDFSNSAD